MDRREALKRTAALTGYALSASTIAAVLNGCKASGDAASAWTPVFFTEDQGALVAEMAECILPRTDTPGAKDVGVHEFIDILLKKYTDEKGQTSFMEGLTAFEADVQAAHQKKFVDLSADQQFDYLQALYVADSKKMEEDGSYKSFFLRFKQNVLAGYFSSEKIGTEVLNYLPVPGEYDGCVPLSEIGNSWSLG